MSQRISERWVEQPDGGYIRRGRDTGHTTLDQQEPEVPSEMPVSSAEVDATDTAVTAAAELGVDLASVEGSGKDGRITKADVEKAAG